MTTAQISQPVVDCFFFSERFGASIFRRVDSVETVKEAELSFIVDSTIGAVRSYFYKFEILGNVSCSQLLLYVKCMEWNRWILSWRLYRMTS